MFNNRRKFLKTLAIIAGAAPLAVIPLAGVVGHLKPRQRGRYAVLLTGFNSQESAFEVAKAEVMKYTLNEKNLYCWCSRDGTDLRDYINKLELRHEKKGR